LQKLTHIPLAIAILLVTIIVQSHFCNADLKIRRFLQFDEDVGFIMHALKEETSFGVGEEQKLIWLLWHQRLHLLRQQTQFEVITSSLNLPASTNKDLPNKLLVS